VLTFADAPDKQSAFVNREYYALVAAAIAIDGAAYTVHQDNTVMVRRLTLGGHLL